MNKSDASAITLPGSYHDWMGDIRHCDQCGVRFVPRREHARFCSARCRLAWNREHLGDPAAAVNALDWSVTAMGEATFQLTEDLALDQPQVVAAVSDAVWWVTIVDATLVRYRSASYDRVLAARPGAERALIEETLAGLRYVRNHIDRHLDAEEFIRASLEPADGVPVWVWNTLPEPICDLLSPRAQDWEIARYRAYGTRLEGQAITGTFTLAAAFLAEAAAPAPVTAPASADSGPVGLISRPAPTAPFPRSARVLASPRPRPGSLRSRPPAPSPSLRRVRASFA